MKLIYVRDYFYLSSQLEVMQQSRHGHRHAALVCTSLWQGLKRKLNGRWSCAFCSPSRGSPWAGFPVQAPRGSSAQGGTTSTPFHSSGQASVDLQVARGRRLLGWAPASTAPHSPQHHDNGKIGWLWQNPVPRSSCAYCHEPSLICAGIKIVKSWTPGIVLPPFWAGSDTGKHKFFQHCDLNPKTTTFPLLSKILGLPRKQLSLQNNNRRTNTKPHNWELTEPSST